MNTAQEPALTTMLVNMAALQERYNQQLADDWRAQGFAFYRAVWVECAELLEHYGWKWWKHHEPDLPQVRLEVVDIWHFGLSMLLQHGSLDSGIAMRLQARLGQPRAPERFRGDVEALAQTALREGQFDVEAFADLLNSLEMNFTTLYREYIGKNVLNRFRQVHGYREGRYRKCWDAREDNEHLVELAQALDPGAPDFPERLYAALEARYASTT